ncbi:MAG: sugar phosphate isomerase/epimerase family protein [Pirellulales bacterium]
MYKNLSTAALGISGTQSEIIEQALSNGFKGLDLDLVDFSQQVKLRGLEQSRRLLDSARLKMGTFQLPVDWQDSDAKFRRDMATLPEALQMAQGLGCLRAVTTLQPASDDRPYHQNFEFTRKRLADIATVLEPLGMRLGVGIVAPAYHRSGKAFEFVSTWAVLNMLIGMVLRPSVGFAVDVWQMHVGGADVVDAVRKLTPQQIVSVSLADCPPEADLATIREESRLLPNPSGVIPSAAVLTALAEMGYDGPITPAPHSKQLAGQRRDQIVQQTAQALDAVWKAAGLNAAGKLTAQTAG